MSVLYSPKFENTSVKVIHHMHEITNDRSNGERFKINIVLDRSKINNDDKSAWATFSPTK